VPAQSQQQQKLFGLALSVKRGDTPRSEASEEVLKIVDSMTEKEIEDFAGTEHEGLPKKVEQKIREMARQTIRERMMSEAKFRKGDMVRVVDNPKYVMDKKKFAGMSGYVKNTIGRDIQVTFPNGRTIMVDPKDLEMNPNESVNEAAGKEAMGIAALTGTRGDAVQKFIDTHEINPRKLFNFLKKGKLNDIMDFVTALSGKPNNPIQQKMVKMFRESVVNEAMVKIEVDMFKQFNQRRPDKTMPMKIDSKTPLSKLLNHTTFKAMKQKYDYIELHYGDKFLGSAQAGTDNWEFKKGRGLQDTSFKESVNENKINIDKKVTNIINTRDFKKFVRYINSFYGKKGVYSSGKDVKEKDIMKALYNVFKRNNSYEWGDGDSVDREFVRDELMKMGILSDKMYEQEVNEANGNFVVYVEKDNGRKKLLRIKKSQRAANMFMSKNMDKILNSSGIRSIGSMSQDQWEKKEAQFAENIKKSDMKTVTKKEWDRTHKDYKGMIKGQPYMMWYDKQTHTTVYGPVQIKG
jgi:ribosomal protein L21E